MVVSSEAGMFFIKAGKRFRIPTDRIFDSWRFQRVIQTTEAALANYRVAGKIGFRDSTLLYSISSGKIYLVSDNLRRHVVSPDALTRVGASFDDAVVVSDDELKIQEEGEPIK